MLALVLACLLPATAIGGLALVAVYREGRAALLDSAQTQAGAMRQAVDGVLASAIAGLQALATSPALNGDDRAEFQEQARRVLPYQAGSNVVLSDLDGRQLVNTLVPYGQLHALHGNPELQRRVIARGEPVVSDVFTGGVTRRPLVAVEVPVRAANTVRATLAMGFLPERFASLIAQHELPPHWVVSMFDRTGTLIARTRDPERYVGKKGPPALLAATERASEGQVEIEAIDGVPMLMAYSRSPVSGWVIAVGVPREQLMARLHVWTAWLLGGSVALLIVGIVAARVLARRIADAIGALVEPAIALGAGHPVTAMTLAVDEATTVARALQRASALLRARTSERDAAAHAAAQSREDAQRFEHAAQHDALTGLANRELFMLRLEQAVGRCSASGARLAVLFVDIDDFKPVNDLHGHAVGDALLRDFAGRLRSGLRADDVVARLGGDEFAGLIEGHCASGSQAHAAALVERLSQPYAIERLTVRVSACIGIAGYPEDGRTAKALLAAADAAMYRAKGNGKRRFSTSDFAAL